MHGHIPRLALIVTVMFCTEARAQEPPQGTAYVESAKVAARVYYDAPYKATAEAAVTAIEKLWSIQIDTMGFSVPLRLRGGKVESGFDVYFTDNLPPQALYTFNVMGDNPDTPQSDCPILGLARGAYITTPDGIEDAMGHILSHASLQADECLEPQLPAYDMFTIAVQQLGQTATYKWKEKLLPGFQSFPAYPLDAVGMRTDYADVYYSFGSALFPIFLDERYGDGDGKLLVTIWRAGMQDGHVTSWNGEKRAGDVANDPDFFQAIDTVLKGRGSSFDQAFRELCVWRYLVGENDDGAHFRDGAQWTGAEVWLEGDYEVADLPLDQVQPQYKLGPYGAAYVALDTAGLAAGDRLVFNVTPKSTAQTRWSADVICQREGAAATVSPLELGGGGPGSVELKQAAECSRAVLVVANEADGSYRPAMDIGQWMLVHDFRYSIKRVAGPAVTACQPGALAAGASHVPLELRGSGFVAGGELAVTLGAGVTVHAAKVSAADRLALTVSVDADAAPGPRDVTLTNGDGAQVSAKAALQIIAADDTAPAGDDESGGCRAAPENAPPRAPLLWLLAPGLLLAVLRRR